MYKVLFITQFNCQGAEKMTLLYAKILHNNGFECDCLQYATKYAENRLRPFIPSWMRSHELTFRKYLLSIPKFVSYLKKNHYDYVFCSHPTTGALLCLVRFFCCKKFKIIVRFSNAPMPHIIKDHYIRKLFLAQADVVISQTNEMKEDIINYVPKLRNKVVVINNPVDKELIDKQIEEEYTMDSSFVNYIGVGKIIPRKGFDVLIKAFYLVKKQIPNSRLYIVGDYSDRLCEKYMRELNELVSDYQLSSSIFFEGFQTNPFKYVRSSDVFVLSSRDEGLPNVLLEALYLGKPVVATECIPYIAQVIRNGENGYAVPVDNVEKLAEAMIKCRNLKLNKNSISLPNTEKIIVNLFINLK